MSLVPVARFSDVTEARIVATALRAGGIEVLVQNEQIGQTDFTLQFALGGFAIMVPEEDAATARGFIRQHRTENFQTPAGAPPMGDPDENADWRRDAARRRGMATRWMVVILFVGPTVVAAVWWLAASLMRMLGGFVS